MLFIILMIKGLTSGDVHKVEVLMCVCSYLHLCTELFHKDFWITEILMMLYSNE